MDEEKTTILEEEQAEEIKDPTATDPGDESEKTLYEDTDRQEPPKAAAITAAPKRPWALYIIIGVLVVGMAVLGYLLLFKESSPQGSSSQQIRQMQQVASQIQGKETKVSQKQDEMLDLMNQYKEKTGESIGINPMKLGENEKMLLQDKIKNEEDVSLKSLLEEINDKNDEIRDLSEEITKLEKLLPKPHVVTKGENHYLIAMNFLLNEKNIEKKQAMKLIERTAIIEPLVPGFKVWNFYAEGEYGTSVTQGTAAVSPNALMRKAKKKLVDARDDAISQKEKLAGEIQVLEEKRTGLINQVDDLTHEKVNLLDKVSQLNTQANSMFYLLDTHKQLKKKGILKSGFLAPTKLKDVPPEMFTTSLDMRMQTELIISADEMGLKKIKDIKIYPRFYRAGADYKIEIAHDKKSAQVLFLSLDKLKNERVVIAVK